jgi:hypothetical protein
VAVAEVKPAAAAAAAEDEPLLPLVAPLFPDDVFSPPLHFDGVFKDVIVTVVVIVVTPPRLLLLLLLLLFPELLF